MPSNHHTHLDHPTLHNLLLGFSSFVVLCGIKALQVMQHQQPLQPDQPPRRRQNFPDDEVFDMLNVLIEQKPKMGQASSFTLTTFNLVARQLSTGRPASSYQTKFNSLKLTYRAIERYINSSGGGSWSLTHGANINNSSPDDVARWEQYLAKHPDCKEISRFRDKGFPFYLKMKEVCADGPAGAEGHGSYTTGSRHDLERAGTEVAGSSSSVYEDASADISAGPTDDAKLYGPQSILENAMQFGNELDLTGLLQLGGHITSPNPLTRMTATSDAMSTISQLNQVSSPLLTHSPGFTSESGSHTLFSDIMLPRSSSTHTTLISSAAKISKPGSRAKTPAASHRAPSAVSSRPSKRSKATSAPSAMADAAAMTTMTGAINRATDCMLGFQSLLTMPQSVTSAQALPETPPQVLSLTSPQSFRSLATAHLNHDIKLPSAIRSALFLEFLHNDTFCQMFTDLEDPVLRHDVAMTWYRGRHPLPSNPAPVSSSSTSPLPASSFGAPAPALWGTFPPTATATSSPGSFSNPALHSVGSSSDGGYSEGMGGAGYTDAEMNPYADYNDF